MMHDVPELVERLALYAMCPHVPYRAVRELIAQRVWKCMAGAFGVKPRSNALILPFTPVSSSLEYAANGSINKFPAIEIIRPYIIP